MSVTWVNPIEQKKTISTLLKTLPKKGRLAWEYNPLRNYRLSQTMYEYHNGLYSLEELNTLFKLTLENNQWYCNGTLIEGKDITAELPVCRIAGELVDFITNELSLSPEHPVHILPEYSYDGSVNLILNDGLNVPRLINTRFSTTGKDTYEIIDRKGDNDTNIYDQGEQFDLDTSLYKRVVKIPKLKLTSVTSGGQLQVGNYHFYFTLLDDDGNESDFIAESGVVSVFIGSSPQTIHSGNRNENSQKQIQFRITNLDKSYPYVQVYYSRTYGEDDLNALTQYARVDKKYIITSKGTANILITGFENTTEVSEDDINVQYNIVDSAKAQATAQNMLFLGNVHKPNIHFEELEKLALEFTPYLKEEQYKAHVSPVYKVQGGIKNSYYDPVFIYNNVGYWDEDLYRLGIVFIQSTGELTDVFNIRGALGLREFESYTEIPYTPTEDLTFDEETFLVDDAKLFGENVKGVISFQSTKDTNTIHAIEIKATKATMSKLKDLGIKGFFFVRQKRMPLTLCQAVSIATDNTAHTPTIPTKGGVLDKYVIPNKTNTYLEFDTPNSTEANDPGDEKGKIKESGINYVSEGFLTRYQYMFKDKAVNWKKIGKIAAIAGAVVVAAAATILTFGAAGAALGIAASTTMIAGVAVSASAATAAIISSITLGAAALAYIGTYTLNAWVNDDKPQLTWTAPDYNTWSGRNVVISPGSDYVQKDTPESRILGGSFHQRIIPKGQEYNTINALLCPEYDVYQELYNQLFTGEEFILTTSLSQSNIHDNGTKYFVNDINNYRHFYLNSYADDITSYQCQVQLQGVPDASKVVMLNDTPFRSRAGIPEEAWRYESIGKDYRYSTKTINKKDDKDADEKESVYNSEGGINSDIIRGNFGPYVAMNGFPGGPATTVNIKTPGFKQSAILDYVEVRIADNSPYFAISDRIDINDLAEFDEYAGNSLQTDLKGNCFKWTLHRGDCYICQFTHRVNRNFKDPSTLYIDDIVDPTCWRKHYKPLEEHEFEKINLSDVNAVQLGMWCTFTVRSRFNLNVRTLDSRDVATTAQTGHEQGFYPYYPMSTEGSFKTPESLIYNRGFENVLSHKYNFLQPDVPAIKNWYGTRIMYSDIQITDAFKNSFRVFRGTHYKDYTRQYGEIVKLINYKDNLFVVFEHGLGLIQVNEKMIAAQNQTGEAYITTNNVLNDLSIISETYGSQWPESVIMTPASQFSQGAIFGVDTVAKKIWKFDGTFSIISDQIVGEFLNNNITISEREKTPFIGIRNVKTFYNAFKQDIMFTFYDDTEGFTETVWNLCYNTTLKKFITFYSWVPSVMENIDNIPFSFDRNTAKWIAKLGANHAENSFARGIVLDRNTYEVETSGIIGTLSLASNIITPQNTTSMKFELCRDIWGNYKDFEIDEDNTLKLKGFEGNELIGDTSNAYIPGSTTIYTGGLYEQYYRNSIGKIGPDFDEHKTYFNKDKKESLEEYYTRVKTLPIFKALDGKRPTIEDNTPFASSPVQILNIRCRLYNGNVEIGQYQSSIAIISSWNKQFLTTDFWKHGQAGLIDICDDICPTYWYGKQHPFEFEFIAVDDQTTHKIFHNLELIANKAEPESFHFEIVGECYDFAKDKLNMYYRQEARKALFQYNGCDVEYNKDFTKLTPRQNRKSSELIHYYYEREDTINEIYDSYTKIRESFGSDYQHLSGAEIKYYKTRNEYRILQHQPAVNLDSLDPEKASSLIRGNCRYLEDKWRVSINPLLVVYKNEYTKRTQTGSLFEDVNSNWKPGVTTGEVKIPPITLYNTNIPKAIRLNGSVEFPGDGEGKDNALYNLYSGINVDVTNWLNDPSTQMTQFGAAQNREEVDIKDRFIKIRIRYSGKDLAVIDFINTIYDISYA